MRVTAGSYTLLTTSSPRSFVHQQMTQYHFSKSTILFGAQRAATCSSPQSFSVTTLMSMLQSTIHPERRAYQKRRLLQSHDPLRPAQNCFLSGPFPFQSTILHNSPDYSSPQSTQRNGGSDPRSFFFGCLISTFLPTIPSPILPDRWRLEFPWVFQSHDPSVGALVVRALRLTP